MRSRLPSGVSTVRNLAIAAATILALVAIKLLLFSADELEPTIRVAYATAVIGEGDDAIGVTPDGEVLVGKPPPEEGAVPRLPTAEVPKSGRLEGTMLGQAEVLGAAPELLRPCVARSSFGEDGIDVELVGGIEIRFGDPTRATEKWLSAATVLADPTITTLDYVNVVSPTRISTGGSGHSLPSPEEAGGGGCGPDAG